MKALGFIIALQFLWSFMFAGSANIFEGLPLPDSLKSKILSAKDEKERINALNDACYYFSDKMPHQVIPQAQKIVYWADSLHYWNGLFDANNNLGILFYRTSRYAQAISCFTECLKIADRLNDAGRRAAVLSNIGLVYTELSQFQRAIDFQQQALKIREKRNDTLAIAWSMNNLGMTYHAQGEWNMALSYYLKAIRTLEPTIYKQELANTYNNIGQLFFTCYNDTASWAADSAEFYFMKAYTRYTIDDNRVGIIKTLINLGNMYASVGNTDKAVDAYRAALNQQRQMGDSAGTALTLYNMAILFDEMGYPKRAYDYLVESMKIAEAYNLNELRRDTYEQLFYLAQKNNDLSLATQFASKFFAINDSLNELSRKLLIEQFQGKYNFQQVENSLLMTKVKKWQQIGWIALSLLAIVALIIVYRIVKK